MTSITRYPTSKKLIPSLRTCGVLSQTQRIPQPSSYRGEPIIKSLKGVAISRIQAYRIIRAAAEALGFGFRVLCHSLHKTFGYHAWKSGVSPAVIMEIYNHSNFADIRRYLGVIQDDKDEAYSRLAKII